VRDFHGTEFKTEILSANALAKTLTNTATNVIFPAMLVKVTTPLYPIQLSGNTTAEDARWQVELTTSGMTATLGG